MKTYTNIVNPKLSAQKTYEWVDRILIMEGSRVLKSLKFDEFLKEIDNWKLNEELK